MPAPTIPALLAAMAAKSYVVFNKAYDLNLIGVRTKPGIPNQFDDWFCVLYTDDKGAQKLEAFPCTTDPGTYYLLNPIHVSGTAVLAPFQNRGAFKKGLHHQDPTHPCLVQAGSVKAYLDANKDGYVDESGPLHDLGPECGIHIHRASATHTSGQVDKYSAGCQVVASPEDFKRVLTLCDLQESHGHGNKYSYTLLDGL